MANKTVNSKVDPSIKTIQSTFISPSSVAGSTTVNTKVDAQLSSKPVTPTTNVSTIISTTTSTTPTPPSIGMNMVINTIVQNYLDSYSGSLGSASRANVANVANSVAYGNITGLPTFATVAFSGNYNDLLFKPTIPSLSGYATESYVTTAISNVIDGAPAALDTLKELAASLSNNSSYASSITSQLAGKVDTSDLSSYATTTYVDNKTAWANISDKPALFSGSYIDLTNKPALFDGAYSSLTGTPTIPTNLDSLSNVTITSATNGEVLKFNGSDWVNGTPSSELSKTYTAGSVVQNTNLSVQPQEISLNASLDPGIDSFGSAITKVKLDNGAVNISSLEQDFPDIVYKTEINVSYYDGVTITNSPGPADTKTWIFKNNGQLQLPVGGDIVDSTGTSVLGGGGTSTGNITFTDTTLTSSNGNVNIIFDPVASPAVSFSFAESGEFSAPQIVTSGISTQQVNTGAAKQVSSDTAVSCPINVDTVIYTSTGSTQHTFKVLLLVEGFEGAETSFDTQSCEMMIAKSFRNDAVAGTVYGLVYTSTNPLATFSTRWNAISSRVEVLCRPTSTTNSVNVRSFVTEIATTD